MSNNVSVVMTFIDPANDAWHPVDEDHPAVPVEPAPHQLLTLERWHTVRAQWPASMPVGVKVPCDTDVEALAPDLGGVGLVALDFPKWTDGRAYSQAHLLRFRFRFTGEIRATGDVVADMLPLLKRTGFDAVVLRVGQSRAVAERALGFFEGHYQGDAEVHAPRFVQRAA